jgi:hypothetical protein
VKEAAQRLQRDERRIAPADELRQQIIKPTTREDVCTAAVIREFNYRAWQGAVHSNRGHQRVSSEGTSDEKFLSR